MLRIKRGQATTLTNNIVYLKTTTNATNGLAGQGYVIFIQRLEQEAGSLKGMSIQRPHVLFNIGDLAKIKESKHKGIEHGEYMGSCPLANLTRVFGKSTIPTVM